MVSGRKSGLVPFFWLHSILWCGCAIISLPLPLWMDMWVISKLRFPWTVLQEMTFMFVIVSGARILR